MMRIEDKPGAKDKVFASAWDWLQLKKMTCKERSHRAAFLMSTLEESKLGLEKVRQISYYGHRLLANC
jgi:hypothetical protein